MNLKIACIMINKKLNIVKKILINRRASIFKLIKQNSSYNLETDIT